MVETRNVDFSIIFSQLVSKWQDVTPKNGGCKAEEAQRIFSLVLWHLYRYFSLVVKVHYIILFMCKRRKHSPPSPFLDPQGGRNFVQYSFIHKVSQL